MLRRTRSGNYADNLVFKNINSVLPTVILTMVKMIVNFRIDENMQKAKVEKVSK